MSNLKTSILMALALVLSHANATTDPECMYACQMQGQGSNSCAMQCKERDPYSFNAPSTATPQCVNQCMISGNRLDYCRLACR